MTCSATSLASVRSSSSRRVSRSWSTEPSGCNPRGRVPAMGRMATRLLRTEYSSADSGEAPKSSKSGAAR